MKPNQQTEKHRDFRDRFIKLLARQIFHEITWKETAQSLLAPKEGPDGMRLARHYQALLDSGKFENRAALARHLSVSQARVTNVLKGLNSAKRESE